MSGPARDAVLDDAALAAALPAVPAWQVVDGALQCTRHFADFAAAMAFVNAVAALAGEHDHHPDIDIRYDTCRLRFVTHSAGGITARDLACAALVDALR